MLYMYYVFLSLLGMSEAVTFLRVIQKNKLVDTKYIINDRTTTKNNIPTADEKGYRINGRSEVLK